MLGSGYKIYKLFNKLDWHLRSMLDTQCRISQAEERYIYVILNT